MIKLTEEQVDILKNPHDNEELLTEDFFKGCGFRGGLGINWKYALVASSRCCNLYINFDPDDIKAEGMFDLYIKEFDEFILFLENHFEFPLLPSKEEKELFYIEHGFEYPTPEFQAHDINETVGDK